MSQYLAIHRLRVHAANALSSPLTYGFPAMTAFLGFGHALERKLRGKHPQFKINGVGTVSHAFEMLDHQAGYKRTLQLTGNPLNEKGERPSFVEEGRCHMTVSLVLEIDGVTGSRWQDNLAETIFAKMKLAGGDIVALPKVETLPDGRAALRKLMPGYVLMDRHDQLSAAVDDQCDALQALHKFLQIEQYSDIGPNGAVQWRSRRAQPGWLVPISIGYRGISPLGSALNTRDTTTPHRFAESVISLGEFVLPTRLDHISDAIWRYENQGDYYLCHQKNDAAVTV
jgi:CRISPR-associated protein Csy2